MPFFSKQSGKGRPLRFLALILLLWTGGRLMTHRWLSHEGVDGQDAAHQSPLPTAAGRRDAPTTTAYLRADRASARTGLAFSNPAPPRPFRQQTGATAFPRPSFPSAMTASTRPPSAPAPAHAIPAAPPATIPPIALPSPAPSPDEEQARRRQWVRSAWLLWRNRSSSPALANGGQLGGSQAGFRADRFLGDGRGPIPLSLYGRLSAALREPAAPETAFGIATHPLSGRAPLMIGLERRIPLDNDGRNAFAVVTASGLNPTRIGAGMTAEGYAQAGLVGFRRGDGFVDGRFSLTAALDRREGASAGVSLSGGGQPGASRLDLGPVLQLREPLDMKGIRLVVEWRQRVAGRAEPGSGPALILARDF